MRESLVNKMAQQQEKEGADKYTKLVKIDSFVKISFLDLLYSH